MNLKDKLWLLNRAQSFNVEQINQHLFEVSKVNSEYGLIASIETDTHTINYYVIGVENSNEDRAYIDMVELKELKEFCEMLFKE